MCGRYSLVCIDDLGNRFRVHNPMIGARSRFNIAPGSGLPVIVRNGGRSEIALMTWGLVPQGRTGSAAAPRLINARAESLAEKPVFRRLLESGRCLVPASGFFEWKTEGRRKIPFYFHLPESPLFAFAGLYDSWQGADGQTVSSYTIITCRPNALMAKVHDRMPVILSREVEDRWLSQGPLTTDNLAEILTPFSDSAMAGMPVADFVNNPAVDDERMVRPLPSSAGRQTYLTD
ncbi:SOS response-associated peptidase [Methanoregula sp.]|uniref:SOS response-associated peptidase n=1 Tax=Methanoregula sp. TaxID=2052170 RepID=UPI0023715007|nr:SOS response-associated peptidase [Methanoregula sp.]MDD1686467.1 SOS response-associated peptidase [Methanoregula sp.]